MNTPTSALTFQDLIIEVAELAGLADYGTDGSGAATVPSDIHDLEKVKRCVNNAIRMFIADKPQSGVWFWRKRFMEITLDVNGTGPLNVEGDSSRYKLDNFFNGVPEGQITYAKASNNGAYISWKSEADIRRARENNTYQGYPFMAAIRPLEDRLFELIIYPEPSSAETLIFPYTVSFNKLDTLTDYPPAGVEFDDVVLAACKARAEMEFDDVQGGWVEYYNSRALPQAWKHDARLAPRTLGYVKNRRGRLGSTLHDRVWNTVTYS